MAKKSKVALMAVLVSALLCGTAQSQSLKMSIPPESTLVYEGVFAPPELKGQSWEIKDILASEPDLFNIGVEDGRVFIRSKKTGELLDVFEMSGLDTLEVVHTFKMEDRAYYVKFYPGTEMAFIAAALGREVAIEIYRLGIAAELPPARVEEYPVEEIGGFTGVESTSACFITVSPTGVVVIKKDNYKDFDKMVERGFEIKAKAKPGEARTIFVVPTAEAIAKAFAPEAPGLPEAGVVTPEAITPPAAVEVVPPVEALPPAGIPAEEKVEVAYAMPEVFSPLLSVFGAENVTVNPDGSLTTKMNAAELAGAYNRLLNNVAGSVSDVSERKEWAKVLVAFLDASAVASDYSVENLAFSIGQDLSTSVRDAETNQALPSLDTAASFAMSVGESMPELIEDSDASQGVLPSDAVFGQVADIRETRATSPLQVKTISRSLAQTITTIVRSDIINNISNGDQVAVAGTSARSGWTFQISSKTTADPTYFFVICNVVGPTPYTNLYTVWFNTADGTNISSAGDAYKLRRSSSLVDPTEGGAIWLDGPINTYVGSASYYQNQTINQTIEQTVDDIGNVVSETVKSETTTQTAEGFNLSP